MYSSAVALSLFIAGAQAHVCAWVKGMYCLNGNQTDENLNANTPVAPLWDLPQDQWWFQADRGCNNFPPADGDFVQIPANGQLTVELAHNRGQTTLGGNPSGVTDWIDGKQHPDDWHGTPDANGNDGCLADLPGDQADGAIHCHNETTAYGSAWAISYQSDLSQVTMDNLVVFSTLEHTPWKRVATYDVPDLPACPDGGCTCAWLWVPNGCGEPNMYMAGYKCQVTGATSTAPLKTPAQAPVYCPGGSGCVAGPKQMIAWNQASGNNVDSPSDGNAPGYNTAMGYMNGAQTDLF